MSFTSIAGETNSFVYNPMNLNYCQKDEKTLHLEFPVEPQTFSDTVEMSGHPIVVTFHMSQTDSGVYALIELELGNLKDSIQQYSSNFFNGMVTYIINDIGAEVDNFTEFEYNGYKGNDFNIISPNKESKENLTSKGKTLLIDGRGYIWFGISDGSDSQNKVNQFLNSYSLK